MSRWVLIRTFASGFLASPGLTLVLMGDLLAGLALIVAGMFVWPTPHGGRCHGGRAVVRDGRAAQSGVGNHKAELGNGGTSSASAATRTCEALPLLLTLSSGVNGFTTVHAGSARQALTRLRFVCQLDEQGSNLPLSALNTLVSEAIDLVVHCVRRDGTPQVTEVIALEDPLGGPEATHFTAKDLFVRPRWGHRWPGPGSCRAGQRERSRRRGTTNATCWRRPGSSPASFAPRRRR